MKPELIKAIMIMLEEYRRTCPANEDSERWATQQVFQSVSQAIVSLASGAGMPLELIIAIFSNVATNSIRQPLDESQIKLVRFLAGVATAKFHGQPYRIVLVDADELIANEIHNNAPKA